MSNETAAPNHSAANGAAPHRAPWTYSERRWEPDFMAPELKLKPLHQVEAKPLVWEGDARLPRGSLTIIAGEHGAGKSLMAIDWAARITRGEPWSASCASPSAARGAGSPADAQSKNYGEAVIAHAGDATAELLRMRLDAADAVPRRVASLALAMPEKGQRFTFDTINCRIYGLTCAIRGTSNVRLLVIDNLEAWAGNLQEPPSAALAGFLLTRLAELAALAEVAIVVLAQLPRRGGQAAARRLEQLMTQAAVVYLAASDPERPDRKLLLPVKNTLAPPAAAKACEIVGGRAVWSDEAVEATADEFLAPLSQRREARHEREFAGRWLLAALADGPVASGELFRQARDCGISTRTLRRAAQSLGLSPRKSSFDGPWQWSLGGAESHKTGEPEASAAASSRNSAAPNGAKAAIAPARELAAPNHPEANASGTPTGPLNSTSPSEPCQDCQPRPYELAAANGRPSRPAAKSGDRNGRLAPWGD